MENLFKIETGLQLYSRTVKRPSVCDILPELLPEGVPGANHFIQIISKDRVPGKTALISHILAKCILPIKHAAGSVTVLLPGRSANAVLIDTDHKFDIRQFANTLEHFLPQSIRSDHGACSEIVKSSLNRLAILNCFSGDQLTVTLYGLDEILLKSRNISLIAFDSISAYYWADLIDKDVPVTINDHCNAILEELFKISKRFNVTVIYSKHDVRGEIQAAKMCKSDYIVSMSKAEHQNGNECNFEAVCFDCRSLTVINRAPYKLSNIGLEFVQ